MILMAACTFLFNLPNLCINAKNHFFYYSCYGLGMDYLWHGLQTLSLHTIPFHYLLCLDVVCQVTGEFEG